MYFCKKVLNHKAAMTQSITKKKSQYPASNIQHPVYLAYPAYLSYPAFPAFNHKGTKTLSFTKRLPHLRLFVVYCLMFDKPFEQIELIEPSKPTEPRCFTFDFSIHCPFVPSPNTSSPQTTSQNFHHLLFLNVCDASYVPSE